MYMCTVHRQTPGAAIFLSRPDSTIRSDGAGDGKPRRVAAVTHTQSRPRVRPTVNVRHAPIRKEGLTGRILFRREGEAQGEGEKRGGGAGGTGSRCGLVRLRSIASNPTWTTSVIPSALPLGGGILSIQHTPASVCVCVCRCVCAWPRLPPREISSEIERELACFHLQWHTHTSEPGDAYGQRVGRGGGISERKAFRWWRAHGAPWRRMGCFNVVRLGPRE